VVITGREVEARPEHSGHAWIVTTIPERRVERRCQ
jgi:hypothetical protein